MSNVISSTGEQLANALHVLGVKFIMGAEGADDELHKNPTRLLVELAQSKESRLRLSLIPLFLEHPEFSLYVNKAARKLESTARVTLECYYTAAIFIRKKYQPRRKPLPDHFSKKLNLSLTNDVEENLRALAKRQREISGIQINWFGTYQHAAQVWLKGLEYQKV